MEWLEKAAGLGTVFRFEILNLLLITEQTFRARVFTTSVVVFSVQFDVRFHGIMARMRFVALLEAPLPPWFCTFPAALAVTTRAGTDT